MHARRIALATAGWACAVLTAGCAVTNSGPVAGFDGSWTISQQGVLTHRPDSLTRAAIEQATAHCAASRKRFRQLDLKESPSGLLSPYAESELKFSCD